MALAISMTEAEYVSAEKACQQELWMKQALIDYGIRLDDVPIMCDNKGTIDLSKNLVQYFRTKHIDICHHFLRDNVQKGNISIEKVASKDNIVDIFTKPLNREVFNYLRLGLGMMELIMDNVANQFVVHFKNFLGQSYEVKKINECNSLFKNMISDDEALSLVEDVSYKEIKDALFDIVKEFFNSGKLLKDLNSTVISLILKSQNPLKVTYYRPIACCNVVYKCINKIQDNILSTQELLKVMIEKVVLAELLVRLILKNFTINVNGENYGFFQGGRSLRKGDPMSLYLFTLVMECLTLMMERNVQRNLTFQFHFGCKSMKIIHVCFADDLLVLCHSDVDSIKAVKDSIDEFGRCSGLLPNFQKSTIFFGNVKEVQEEIIKNLPSKKGKLPVKYLGVPLITKRLGIKNYKFLVDKDRKGISNWKNKCLSYAGRLQLIASILESIQVYKCSVFLLPNTVIKEINSLLMGFLWCNGEISRGKAKISWKKICKPKSHGGLGLKDLEIWNKVLLVKHI
ncbi:RNA-directed DNA polymerase, eukaryota, reverse transcriptase zinc-binding domain protein [Tanacetum coccineum]